MSTTTRKTHGYRIMVKMRWSSRYTELYRTPDLVLAKQMVKDRINGKDNSHVWDRYREYPYDGAEFKIEGRTITVTTEVGSWKPARKLEAEIATKGTVNV